MLKSAEYRAKWPELRRIFEYLKGRYEFDMRFYERAKFMFIWKKSRETDVVMRGLTLGLACEIAEFI
jgi:hypothetical protein